MTLVRISVVVVFVASALVVFYGLVLDRSGQNIAFTVAGLVALGLTMIFVASWFLGRALKDARWGRTAGALLGGLMGGLFAIGAAMSLAAASVFAILTRLT